MLRVGGGIWRKWGLGWSFEWAGIKTGRRNRKAFGVVGEQLEKWRKGRLGASEAKASTFKGRKQGVSLTRNIEDDNPRTGALILEEQGERAPPGPREDPGRDPRQHLWSWRWRQSHPKRSHRKGAVGGPKPDQVPPAATPQSHAEHWLGPQATRGPLGGSEGKQQTPGWTGTESKSGRVQIGVSKRIAWGRASKSYSSSSWTWWVFKLNVEMLLSEQVNCNRPSSPPGLCSDIAWAPRPQTHSNTSTLFYFPGSFLPATTLFPWLIFILCLWESSFSRTSPVPHWEQCPSPHSLKPRQWSLDRTKHTSPRYKLC